MSVTIPTVNGSLVINERLLDDLKPVLCTYMGDIKRISNRDSVMGFVFDLFDEDEAAERGVDFSLEELSKLGVFTFNIYIALFNDPKKAAQEFNELECPLQLGIDQKGFYPNGQGNWYGMDEMIFIPA